MEVSPGDLLRKFASLCHKVEKLASANILEDDGEAAVYGLILLLVGGVLAHADKLDQVLVVELLHDVEFVLEGLEGGRFFFIFLDGD
jgi:hypothetical protein